MQSGTVKLSLRQLMVRAVDRPPGYYDHVLSKGVVEGENLVLTHDAYQQLLAQYREPKKTPEEKRAQWREFREKFLGDIAGVPPEVMHIRLMLEQQKQELTAAACTSCQLGSAITAAVEQAWLVMRRIKASQNT